MTNTLERLANVWDSEVVMPLREQMIGRQLLPRNNTLSGKGIGMESVDYYTFSDLSDAIIDYNLPDTVGSKDTVDMTTTTIKMAFIAKQFNIKRSAFEAYKLKGIPIDDKAALTIADLVAIQENTLFIQGWAPDGSTYRINGMYQAASNTEATVDDFGTYGNPTNKITLAIGMMLTDNILPPYNLTLNPTQYAELLGSESTTGTREWDNVKELLNPNGGNAGQIRMTTALTAGTGMLSGIGIKYFDYIEGQAPKFQLTLDPKMGALSPVYGVQYEAIVPRIYKTDAVCRLTNI
jgi:hypothetical protein